MVCFEEWLISLADIIMLQGVAKSLHKDCVARMEPSKVGFSSFSISLSNL